MIAAELDMVYTRNRWFVRNRASPHVTREEWILKFAPKMTASFTGAELAQAVTIVCIHAGGGFGSILGRNSFQRLKTEALHMLGAVMDIYAAPPTQAGTS